MSYIRDLINVNLVTGQQIDNRRTKVLLIKYLNDTISFTYRADTEIANGLIKLSPAV